LVLLDGVGACEFLMKEGLGTSKVTVEILRRDTVNSEEAFVEKIFGKQCAHAFDASSLLFTSQSTNPSAYSLSLCTDYVFEAMYHNDELRAQLDVWKTRNQDAVAVLQLKMRRHADLTAAVVTDQLLTAIAKSVFSHARTPGRHIIKGLIAFAKSATPQMLDLMVSFPFEVPGFFFRELPSFSKLSGVCSGWYVSTLCLLLNACAPCHLNSTDEQQLFAVNSLVHRASTAARTTPRAVTYEEFQAVLYEAGWATLNAMSYADFCTKQPNKTPVRTSTTLRLQRRAARVRACVRRLRAYMLVCVRCARACVRAVCARPLAACMRACVCATAACVHACLRLLRACL
jgi:hypothetical protein